LLFINFLIILIIMFFFLQAKIFILCIFLKLLQDRPTLHTIYSSYCHSTCSTHNLIITDAHALNLGGINDDIPYIKLRNIRVWQRAIVNKKCEQPSIFPKTVPTQSAKKSLVHLT